MIYLNTRVTITDNSGGKIGECIKVLGSKYGKAYLSSLIIVAIKKAATNKKVRLHDVRIGVVVRMSRITRRQNGTSISFGDNAVILIDKRDNPVGSRLFGPVASELVLKKYSKIVFMSSSII
jgi:large subunit ribosomal protein L14